MGDMSNARMGAYHQDQLLSFDVPRHLKVHEVDKAANVKSWENGSVHERLGMLTLIDNIQNAKQAEEMWVGEMNMETALHGGEWRNGLAVMVFPYLAGQWTLQK